SGRRTPAGDPRARFHQGALRLTQARAPLSPFSTRTPGDTMKRLHLKALVAAATIAASGAALADITIGVVAPLTGPASGLGIPVGNEVKLWPKEIAGEKLNYIVLDDATDPTNGVKIAQKFVTQDKVDIIMGSVATPVAAAIAQVAEE